MYLPVAAFGRTSTRERLIDSTREPLWERGYVGTSPKAVKDRSGVGQGSVYRHFGGKADLALAAINRSAVEPLAAAEAQQSAPGTAVERVAGFLRRQRDVLRGCPVGRLTRDPEVTADPGLREPVRETFARIRVRLAQVPAAGRERGEPGTGLDPDATAATVVAVLQGGYVLARAADGTGPFAPAVDGLLGLLAAQTPAPGGPSAVVPPARVRPSFRPAPWTAARPGRRCRRPAPCGGTISR